MTRSTTSTVVQQRNNNRHILRASIPCKEPNISTIEHVEEFMRVKYKLLEEFRTAKEAYPDLPDLP